MGEAGGFNSKCRGCPCHAAPNQPKEDIEPRKWGKESVERAKALVEENARLIAEENAPIKEIGELVHIEPQITNDPNLSYGLGVMKDKIDELVRAFNRLNKDV